MRKRLHEASDNDIILSSIYELTHLYDEDGNEVPSYFNIKEIIDNYGLSQKDVIDIAKNHNYNVFRIPGGDDLVNTIVIAHEDLSYGDVVKEDTTKVDIKELGDDTDDSFNMEEDMEEVKPWGQRKIYDQIKQDTNNFTIEKDEYIYAFEEECKLAYKILEKKYEDVDYWFTDNAFSPTGESWHISFSNPIKGKKKVVKEEECSLEEDKDSQMYRGYKLVFHQKYNVFINMKEYWKVYDPNGTLVGSMKTIDAAKELVDRRIANKSDIYESVSDSLIGKKVIYKDEEYTIENVDEDEDDILFTLSNGKDISVKTCVEKGIISSDDVEVNKLFDTFKVKEEPKKVEPEIDLPLDPNQQELKNKEEVINQAMQDAMDDYDKYKKNSPMIKEIQKARKTGKYDRIPTMYPELYADTYFKEFMRIKNSVQGKVSREYFGVIEKTYQGDVEELIKWLRSAITNITVSSGDALMKVTQERVDFLNDRDDTDVDVTYQNTKQWSSWIADITQKESILKNAPKEFFTWKIEKNSGVSIEDVDVGLVYNQKQNKLTSNAVVLDLLFEYNFKLGVQNKKSEDLEEDIEKHDNHYLDLETKINNSDEKNTEMFISLKNELKDALRNNEIESSQFYRLNMILDYKFNREWARKNYEPWNLGEDIEKHDNEISSMIIKEFVKPFHMRSNERTYANWNDDFNRSQDYYKTFNQCIKEFNCKLTNKMNTYKKIYKRDGSISHFINNYQHKDYNLFKDYIYETDPESSVMYKVVGKKEDILKLKNYLETNPIYDKKYTIMGFLETNNIEEDIEKHDELIYKVAEKLKNNINSFEDELITLSQIEGVDVEEIKQREPMQIAKALVEEGIVDFRMFEDIEKHDTLNPKLFNGEELKQEVKEAIQKIVDEFIKELNEDEVNFTLKDIILLGSNVSYNYTKDSDLDIHLIADSSALDCSESLIDKLYGAYRSIFNKNYDITIKGIPAEIYVELDEPKAMSNGIYSLNNGWIKKPEVKEIPDLDEEAFDNLFTIWENDYFDLLERDSTSDEVAQFIENIYELRKESIAEEGEYGLGNLVFKEFRNLGYLDRLKDLRKELKGKELSLEHLDEELISDEESFWNMRETCSKLAGDKYDEVNLILDGGEIRPISKEELANKFAVSIEQESEKDYKTKEELEAFAKETGAEKIMFFVYKGKYGGEYSFLYSGEDLNVVEDKVADIARKYNQKAYAMYDEKGNYHEILV